MGRYDEDWLRMRVRELETALNVIRADWKHQIELGVLERQDQFRKDFQELFDNTDAGLFVHEFNRGTILNTNRRVTEMIGYESEYMCGKTVGMFSPREKRYSDQAALEVIQRAETNGFNQTEWICMDLSGNQFPAEVTLRPVMFGGQKSVLASVRDVSTQYEFKERILVLERERQKLKENAFKARRLELITDAIPQAIWVSDHLGNLTFCNSRFFEITGLNKETRNEWLDKIHPEDAPHFRRSWTRSLNTGATFGCEFRFFRNRSSESQPWYFARGVARYDKSGTICEWYGTISEWENRLR